MKKVFGNILDTDARLQDSINSNRKKADTANVQFFSIYNRVEKIVLKSLKGSREVLLTKNETLRKLSFNSETKLCVVEQRDKQWKSTSNSKLRILVPKNTSRVKDIVSDNQSRLSILRSWRSDYINSSNKKNRIRLIKFIKRPLINSIVIDNLNSNVKRSKVPPKIPQIKSQKNVVHLWKRSSLKSLSSTRVKEFIIELEKSC